MEIKKNSGVYSFKVEQHLPITPTEAWSFFSSPKNLESITPKDLSFKITSNDLKGAYSGQIVTYKIGIFPIIKTNWVTEIKNVVSGESFIDEQRFGPYKMWHHQHMFQPDGEGTMVTDVIHFKLPFGLIGHLMYTLFIKKKLTQIFEYRKIHLASKFQ